MSVVSLVICPLLLLLFVFAVAFVVTIHVASIRFYPRHNYMYKVNTNLWQCSFIGPWKFVIFVSIWNSTGPAEPITHCEWLIFKLWTESLNSDGQQFHQYQSPLSQIIENKKGCDVWRWKSISCHKHVAGLNLFCIMLSRLFYCQQPYNISWYPERRWS